MADRLPHDLSDSEFFSALQPPAAPTDQPHLTESLAAATRKQWPAAYSALSRHFIEGRSTALIWERHDDEKAEPVKAITSVAAGKLAAATYPQPADVEAVVATIEKITRYILNADKPARLAEHAAALPPFLFALNRHASAWVIHRYPFYGPLGIHSHFHLIWRAYLAMNLVANHRANRDDAITPTAAEAKAVTDASAVALKLILALGRESRIKHDRYIVHNIYTAGVFGLFNIARKLPEFREADEWDQHAVAMLDLDWDRSFYDDGGHLERNWGYGSHTLNRHVNIWNFAKQTGGLRGREEHYADGIRRGFRFYPMTMDACDRAPSFGDEGIPEIAHVLDDALASGLFPEGTARDLGVDRSVSRFLPGCGAAFMRNGADKNDAYVNITFGEFAGWHSHFDLLSMNLRAQGLMLLEEQPRFGAYEHPLDPIARTAEAHNQLVVDRFHYNSWREVGDDVAWHSDEHVDWFTAYHRAHQAVPLDEHRPWVMSADLIVRRTIAFVKNPGYAVVLDSVMGEAGADFNRATTQHWHSPLPFRTIAPDTVQVGGSVRGKDSGKNSGKAGCLMTWARPASIRRIESGVDFNPEDLAVHSHAPASDCWRNLGVKTWMDHPSPGCLGYATLLLPYRGGRPEATIKVLPLKAGVPWRAEAVEISTPAGRDVFVLNPERMPDVAFRNIKVPGRGYAKLARKRGESTWSDA